MLIAALLTLAAALLATYPDVVPRQLASVSLRAIPLPCVPCHVETVGFERESDSAALKRVLLPRWATTSNLPFVFVSLATECTLCSPAPYRRIFERWRPGCIVV